MLPAAALEEAGEAELPKDLKLVYEELVRIGLDLMKQSLIRFLMNEADVCAKILAEHIDERARTAFQGAKRWERWARERHGVVARNFSLVVMLPVTILPAIVLRGSPGSRLVTARSWCSCSSSMPGPRTWLLVPLS